MAELGDQAGKIVDFSDFEHQKENIQPVTRGRSAAVLSQLYGKTDTAGGIASQQSSRQADGRRSFELGAQGSAEPSMRGNAEGEADSSSTSSGQEAIRVAGHLQTQNAQFQAEIAAQDPAETDDPLDVHYRYVQWIFEVFPQASGNQAVIKLVERPLRLFNDDERYRNDARFVKMWIWYIGIINSGQEAVFQYLLANRIGDSLAITYEEYARLLESTGMTRKADEIYRVGVARRAQPLARLQRRYSDFQRRVVAQTVRAVDADADAESNANERRENSSSSSSAGENVAPGARRTVLGTKRSARSTRSAAANTLPASQRGVSGGVSGGDGAGRANARISVYSDGGGERAGAEPAAPAPWGDIGSDEGRRKENIAEASSWRGQTLAQRRVAATAPHGTPTVEKFAVFRDGDGSDAAPDASERVKEKSRARAAERMVMPAELLFPGGDGVPQSAEEARARLPQYRFDPAEAAGDSDDDDGGIADESASASARRGWRSSGVGASSPTINTRVAQKAMLGIWNDAETDTDTDADADAAPDADTDAGGGRRGDDDYQFTMGPVTPNVVPRGAPARAAIPVSARPAARFAAFLDENAPPESWAASAGDGGSSLDAAFPPIPPAPRPRHSTPAHTHTRTGLSATGAELTRMSGFTGLSSVGAPSRSVNTASNDDGDDDVGVSSARRLGVLTPVRKRLSMAARDLGAITPRFPAAPAGSRGGVSDGDSGGDSDDDDVDDDDEDACTENMGEFGVLDSQMSDLQMALSARHASRPGTPARSFSVFRD
ncbi:protein kinase [Coemansia sp. Benny D160-2]|nr:protein kinase [Coemansia sp. Benny D160-2]